MQPVRFEIVPQPMRVELPEYKCGRERRRERRKKERKYAK